MIFNEIDFLCFICQCYVRVSKSKTYFVFIITGNARKVASGEDEKQRLDENSGNMVGNINIGI